ncbi:hypothetical protein [Ralstonia solanacearum]|uniref:Uncharacterized protein n=1 Tax=Ralstonia solanacearum TaxID=305 RepID=A0A7X0UJ83_RALSL|nr:hypothetical protein [Ralstonia solanacearum]MBB6581910.1 hypothetical protein [Ralstonia solanacearum]MBB6584721.1 hypothetical protein [Ralstonia solanacearum]MDB0524544.1 hypothetical protein [Ralstonia solanacearum]
MATKKVTKKKYLKILNKRLRAEPDAPSTALFVFYPPGAKAKHATGVAASEPSSPRELPIMAEIQRIAATELIVIDMGDRLGNGRRRSSKSKPEAGHGSTTR